MTATESRGGSPQDSAATEIIGAKLVAGLSTLIDALEAVEWHRVPGASTAAAATFTRGPVGAREDIRRGA